jgi:hypothetical protein
MLRFRNIEPEFYIAYDSAREITDKANRRREPEASNTTIN